MRVISHFCFLMILAIGFSSQNASAQNDPKKTPGLQIKVTKVDLVKKVIKATSDTLVDVKIQYIKPDGSKGELIMNNVGYSTSPVNHDKDVKQPKTKANFR